jgi:hypothetical protein
VLAPYSLRAGTTGGCGKKEKPAVNAADLDSFDEATEALGDHEGAVLVMDPKTGRLRTVINPTAEQAFPPGSTIKSFTASPRCAGLIDRESRTLCRDDSPATASTSSAHPKSKAHLTLLKRSVFLQLFFAT